MLFNARSTALSLSKIQLSATTLSMDSRVRTCMPVFYLILSFPMLKLHARATVNGS